MGGCKKELQKGPQREHKKGVTRNGLEPCLPAARMQTQIYHAGNVTIYTNGPSHGCCKGSQ